MQWFVCMVEDVSLMHLLVTVGRCCVRVRSCTLMQQLQREEEWTCQSCDVPQLPETDAVAWSFIDLVPS